MLWEHSFRKAYISIAVGVAVMAVLAVVLGPPLSDTEFQIVGWIAFVAAFANQEWLYYREDRARGLRAARPRRPSRRSAGPRGRGGRSGRR